MTKLQRYDFIVGWKGVIIKDPILADATKYENGRFVKFTDYSMRLQEQAGELAADVSALEAENERLREVLLSLLADDSTCFGGAVEWYKRTDAAKAILNREQEKP